MKLVITKIMRGISHPYPPVRITVGFFDGQGTKTQEITFPCYCFINNGVDLEEEQEIKFDAIK